MMEANCDSPAVLARGLVKRFKKCAALDHLDLTIARDRVTVILGRNGAGKSTLLRLANGMLAPDRGGLMVMGRDPMTETNAVRFAVGFVPDAPDVPAWMTPLEWLAFLKPHYPRFDTKKPMELIDRFHVSAGTRFSELSKGQAMLAMLAAATAHEPELLLLDEPFGALDPIARDEVLKALITELRDRGRTVVLTTHDLEVACRVADDVVVIDRGRVSWQQSADTAGAEPLPQRLREHLAATSPRARADSDFIAVTASESR